MSVDLCPTCTYNVQNKCSKNFDFFPARRYCTQYIYYKGNSTAVILTIPQIPKERTPKYYINKDKKDKGKIIFWAKIYE